MTTETPIDTSIEIKKAAPKPRKAPLKPAPADAETGQSTDLALTDGDDDGDTRQSHSATFVSQAQDTVRKVANTGKDRATDALSELAEMIEDVAKTIDYRVGDTYGDYARKASGSITGVADNLKSKDVDELLDDAREFIRTQPAIAIGAAAAVGFVLTRLIKSGDDDSA